MPVEPGARSPGDGLPKGARTCLAVSSSHVDVWARSGTVVGMGLLEQPRAGWVPPVLSEEEKAQRQLAAEEARQRSQAQWRQGWWLRRVLARAVGLSDAAADCHCSCHPRVGDFHDQGRTCPCQLSEEEKLKARDEFLDALAMSSEEDDHFWRTMRQSEEEAIAEGLANGWETLKLGGLVPFTIEGRFAGWDVYVRERHDEYRIEISNSDQDPLIIAEGISEELYGESGAAKEALAFTTDMVRTYLARLECEHEGAHNYCPWCGTSMRNV